MLQLRYYQEDSIKDVMRDRAAGVNKVIVALPTGTGKSAVQNNLIKRHYPIQKFRTIFIGGLNRSLNHQGMRGFIREYPDCQSLIEIRGRMRPGIGIVMGSESAPDARIVVASAQTITPSYLKDKKAIENQKLTPEDVVMRDGGIFLAKNSKRRWMISARMDEILAFGPLNVWLHDECHHAPADGTLFIMRQLELIYQFLDLPPMHVVGFTATPMRNDDRALANCFDRISYQMDYETAQEQGFLAPLSDKLETVEILTNVQVETGDSAEAEVIAAAENWDEIIIKAYQEKAPKRTAVAFVGPINGMRAVQASKHLAAKFNEAGITAVHVDADFWIDEFGNEQSNKKRDVLFDRIMAGEIKVVCNFNVLVEGVDLPILDCVLLARSVNEVSLTQILGRILRLYAGDPKRQIPAKQDALLIDFTGQQLVVMTHGTMVGVKVDPFGKPLPKEAGDQPEKIVLKKKSHNVRDMVPFGYIMGAETLFKPIQITKKSKHVWHVAPDSWMSMSIGEGNAIIITAPHYGTADKYLQLLGRENLDPVLGETIATLYDIYSNFCVWHVKDKAIKDGESKRQSPALNEIERFATGYAESCPEYTPTLSKKGRGWRSPTELASEKQIGYLTGLLSKREDDWQRVAPLIKEKQLTKDAAAKLITHELSRQAIQSLIDNANAYVERATA